MEMSTDITHAAKRLQAGDLVAMPTETVYGLAANALDAEAVQRIYQAKGRPSYNPLIVHVPDVQTAMQYVEWNVNAERLSQAFWPGPLTMVLKKKPDCPIAPVVSAGLDTLAIRVPAHPIARALLVACGLPLAAPSANRSGHVTATNAAHVAEDFAGKDVLILGAGDTEIGLESTVVSLVDTPVMLRPGSITHAQLEAALQCTIARAQDNNHAPNAPGMLSSHYAPNAALRLNATHVEAGEVLLAFGAPLAAKHVVNVSEQGDLAEASSNLFSALRALDRFGATTIAVMPIPSEGIGEAINDRLRRAAAPKDGN